MEETVDNEEKITEPEKTLDDYDFFKKKNIDVEKLVNEVPTASSSSALPFIDVDSDFEIKDDKDEAKPNNVFVEDENLTQNRANEMDEKTAETEEVSDDVFAGFGSFGGWNAGDLCQEPAVGFFAGRGEKNWGLCFLPLREAGKAYRLQHDF